MKRIIIAKKAGTFAENKDIARDIRINEILPLLEKDDTIIVLDFKDVTGATQSFVHALISDLIRQYDNDIFTRVLFKNCNPVIQQVINIVADYMEAS